MANLRVRTRVVGAQELNAKLAYIRKTALPSLVDRNSLGAFLVQRMRDRFVRAVDPQGQRWKALSPRTQKRKRKGILRVTENLYNSVAVMEGTDRGGYALATGYGFRVGIKSRKYMERSAKGKFSRQVDTAVYGRRHQLGLGVPPRRFIGVSTGDTAIIAKMLKTRLRQVLEETSGVR